MSSFNRRDFLATSSLVAAGVGLGLASPLKALPIRSKRPVAEFFPDVVDVETLRALALAGVEAAKAAGASYADIRVGDRREFGMVLGSSPVPSSRLAFDYSYGVRVLVDGAWSFAYGADPTKEGISQAAKQAVATARGLAKVSGQAPQMVPAPVVKGEWATPVKIDPFAVSPDDHAYMLGAYRGAAGRVPDGGDYQLVFNWTYETRVFASSEGSLTTQKLSGARPRIVMQAGRPIGMPIQLAVDDISTISAGFEIAIGPKLQENIKIVTEDATRLLDYPEGEVDVGRYAVAVDGTTMGAMFGATVLPALELERVLGHEADAGGTSFLAPVDDILGQQTFSNKLNVAVDRGMPSYGAAKWDDEGVETEPYNLIEQGKIVDYMGTRATISTLANWYKKSGKTLKSHGSAFAWETERNPVGSASHVSIAPSSSASSLDEMVRGLKDGLMIRGVDWVGSDQQLTSGAIYPRMIFEVKNGKITRRVKGAAVQFTTKKLWSALASVGDANSVQVHTRRAWRGQPGAETTQVVAAPSAFFSEINVINTGRKL